MTSWNEVESAAPELAGRVRERFEAARHHTLATLRRDGSPRISGTEVAFGEGDLRLGSMPGAVKLADLRRDPRLALHSATVDPVDGREAEWPGEAKVAGRAVVVQEEPQGATTFRVEIVEVALTTIAADASGLCIESWHPATGYRKRLRT